MRSASPPSLGLEGFAVHPLRLGRWGRVGRCPGRGVAGLRVAGGGVLQGLELHPARQRLPKGLALFSSSSGE